MGTSFNIYVIALESVGLLMIVIGARVGMRIILRRRRAPSANERCRCGYVLDPLTVPRCPECGRVVGFDATPEALGLTDRELERAQAARLRRKAI